METNVPYHARDWTSDNLKEAWTRFRNHASLMFQGTLSGKTEKNPMCFLLILMGDKGLDIFSTLTITADEKDKIEVYLNKFSEYFNPRCNTIFSRYLFHKGDGEPVGQFITDLKLLARECAYYTADIRKEMMRDLCVVSPQLRSEKNFSKQVSNLTLSQPVTIVKAHVGIHTQLRTILQPDTSDNKAFQEIQTKQEADFIRKKKRNQTIPKKKPATSVVVNIHPPKGVQQEDRFVVTVTD